jgi:hypothetical protein
MNISVCVGSNLSENHHDIGSDDFIDELIEPGGKADQALQLNARKMRASMGNYSLLSDWIRYGSKS